MKAESRREGEFLPTETLRAPSLSLGAISRLELGTI